MSTQSEAALRLPTRGGRPGAGPRVAMLVYNDAHNDARVLKEAAALREAGATVRIFAVARERAGYGEGLGTVGEGLEVSRAAEFSLDRVLPALAAVRSRLTGIADAGASSSPQLTEPVAGSAQPCAGEGTSPAAAPTETGPSQPATQVRSTGRRASASGMKARVLRWARAGAGDVAMRAYKTVSLADFWRRTVRDVINWRPDVVHANDANTLWPAMQVCKATGARLVYDSHELWRHRNVRTDRPIAPHVEAAIERAGMERADAVITVSPSIQVWLAEHYPSAHRAHLVRNIPAAGPAPDPSRGRLRELAGLGEDTKVIAYGGRITTSRGLEETIAALAHLDGSVHLVMLGYGEADYLASLTVLAEELGVADRIHRVGPVAPHEVADALSDADVSVVHVRPTCLSYRFALPNKLFESIRGGLPVAAANLPDIAQVVRSLGVGELFSGEDPEDLARTIEQIVANPEPYRAAARNAAAGLTWEQESRELIAAYREALMGKERA